MTIDELAAASGVSARTISDLELGVTRRARERTLTALVTALSVDADGQSSLMALGRTGGEPPRRGTAAMPRSLAEWVGRSTELAWLSGVVETPPSRAALICGMPGAGKTALAVQATLDLAETFTHGMHFVDLHGLDAAALASDDVAARILRSLGVADRRIPTGGQALLDSYQQTLADRNALLVLDNVAAEQQIGPLLPREGGTRVLLTSRRRLSGLADIARLELPALSTGEAIALLELMLTGSRPAEALAGLDELAHLCGNLPLALRIAGNHLLTHPDHSVSQLVTRMHRQGRIAALHAGDLRLDEAFSLSYQQLSTSARLVLHRITTVEPPTTPSTQAALAELVEAGLLSETPRGGYQIHELVEQFARMMDGTMSSAAR